MIPVLHLLQLGQDALSAASSYTGGAVVPDTRMTATNRDKVAHQPPWRGLVRREEEDLRLNFLRRLGRF